MHSYGIRVATPDDLGEARAVMLDAVYRDFGTGYVPGWHEDVIDLAGFYVTPDRHVLLVAYDEADGTIVGTGALDSRGPRQPQWLADRYPDGETAQLRRVYVRPEHRRRGLAGRLVGELLDFAARDERYRSVYLHAYRHSPGALGLWRTLGKEIWEDDDVVHFEIALDHSAERRLTAG